MKDRLETARHFVSYHARPRSVDERRHAPVAKRARCHQHCPASRLWIKCRPDRTRRLLGASSQRSYPVVVWANQSLDQAADEIQRCG